MLNKKMPLAVCFLAGVFGLVQYFSPHPMVVSTYSTLLDWVQIIFAFTLIVGVLSVFQMHFKRISRRERFWGFSIITLMAIVVMAVAGFAGGTDSGSVFVWMFDNMQVPMQSTVFALLAFFVASAAYRGFRLRNVEAGILLATALVIMLGRIPVGELIGDFVPASAEWILNVPSMAAKRAVLIGIGLGSITTALRVILGIERSYLGRN
ncbi:MAG: hypothetical protein KKG33_08295 [candidate division Zixibacteria bacterium]|nr:hypothetical protein [candidate division Zixibacteria bacterium]MBU1470967.1 hypothetical protein [candidate division Zixibacteria bacterium]MBU2625547.1 hypothetical protein [candidate division Zixibacteria bacterium]